MSERLPLPVPPEPSASPNDRAWRCPACGAEYVFGGGIPAGREVCLACHGM